MHRWLWDLVSVLGQDDPDPDPGPVDPRDDNKLWFGGIFIVLTINVLTAATFCLGFSCIRRYIPKQHLNTASEAHVARKHSSVAMGHSDRSKKIAGEQFGLDAPGAPMSPGMAAATAQLTAGGVEGKSKGSKRSARKGGSARSKSSRGSGRKAVPPSLMNGPASDPLLGDIEGGDVVEDTLRDPDEALNETVDGTKDHPASSKSDPLFLWVRLLYYATEKDILATAGLDALFYLKFNRYIVYFLSYASIASCAVLLPLHIFGGADRSEFAVTTISNIANEDWYWVHLVFVYAFSAGAIYTLYRYYKYVQDIRQTHTMPAHVRDYTLIIKHLPLHVVDDGPLFHYFDQIYPGDVLEANVALDLGPLVGFDEQWKEYQKDIEHYKAFAEVKGYRKELRPTWWKFWSKTDAIIWSKQQQRELENKTASLAQRKRSGTGYGFVTFRSLAAAQRAFNDHQVDLKGRRAANESLAMDLKVSQWKVRFAPHPKSIRWGSLRVGWSENVFRTVLINTALFVFLLFWSTPVAILTALNQLRLVPGYEEIKEITKFGGTATAVLFAWLPTLALFMIAWMAMPAFLKSITLGQGYPNASKLERAVLRKNFSWFLLNLLILPSLLQGSLDALIETGLDPGLSIFDAFGRSFLPNSGAFFVNMLTQFALLGNSYQIFRPFHFVFYKLRLRGALTAKERVSITMSPAGFEYGFEYGAQVALFAVSLFFSTHVPLVVAAGWLYFILKYYVDKYNMLYLHPLQYESDLRIPLTVINYALFVVLFFDAAIIGFFRLKEASLLSWLAGIPFLVTLGILIATYVRSKAELRERVIVRVQEAKDVNKFRGAYRHPGLFLADRSSKGSRRRGPGGGSVRGRKKVQVGGAL